MDRADIQTRRRDLDRQLLALADRYTALGERIAAEAVTNPHLNPYGSVTDGLFGMAAAIRAVARRWAPETRAFAAVYAVVKTTHGEVLSVWWSRAQAEEFMRAQGLTGSVYGVDAYAVGHPEVDVGAHEHAARWLADSNENDEPGERP